MEILGSGEPGAASRGSEESRESGVGVPGEKDRALKSKKSSKNRGSGSGWRACGSVGGGGGEIGVGGTPEYAQILGGGRG